MPSTTAPSLSIPDTFRALREKKQIALMPFIAAGFPDLATTQAMLPAIEQAGGNLIEVGFPFSDPIADGPVIQEAFTAALEKKLKMGDIFATVSELRKSITIPLVSMVSYSIVFRYGLDRFLKDAKAAGFSGLILPDLPPPEAESVCDTVRSAGLDTVLLVAPTTSPQRRKEIARLSSGFIYYLSISGITGERDKLPADLESNVRELKSMTDVPVCVGFGINKAEHVKQLEGVADGAIVGTAFVRRAREHLDEGPQAIAEATARYCKELLSLVR
jgi:tryptophan synthase alpha chain